MDVNAGKSARLAAQYNKVLSERDDLKKRLELAQEMIEEERTLREKAQKARDALTAYVERLREAFRATIDSDWSVPMEEALEAALDDDAAASLARRRAQWQAEAISIAQVAFDNNMPGDYYVSRAWIDDLMEALKDELLRQAEEIKP